MKNTEIEAYEDAVANVPLIADEPFGSKVANEKKLEKMDGGKLLKVLCDAPASAEDTIPRFAEKEGFTFEAVKVEDKGYWELYIKKG